MKAADVILFTAGLALLAFLAKRAESMPPPVPRMPSAAELFANEVVTGTL